ncbi:transposase [Chryseobacterium sp. FH1]|uniref:transposase n=1 Tax=Chryseobacterium sp. FH1 TaxID=1233951 RepID=UPI0004E3A590|nr:transposase [Chryseobacterium sp. FH1]KFC21605.1 transposase [Chryseobacterium sp. FH1]
MANSDSTDKILNFKNIHIGGLIKQRVLECEIEDQRICNFLKCSDTELLQMYEQESLDSEILLRWSKILSYDFFRIYSQHLIFYSPPTKVLQNQNVKKTALPTFRKNIYTQEVIDFILEQIESKEMTKSEVIERYNIPKTTLYKWMYKNKINTTDETKL